MTSDLDGRRETSPTALAGAAPGRVIDLAAVVDSGPLSGQRVAILALILVALLADGYDITVISFIAPAVVRDWRLQSDAMASVFSAGLAGMIVGALAMGAFADWRGRRMALLASLGAAALGMLGSATATDVVSLASWRFATGLGVGAIVPVGLVLAAEYAPSRLRATLLSLLLLGLGAGGTGLAGWLASTLMPALGWRWLLYLGGVLSLVVTLILALALPESLKFLFTRRAGAPALLRQARRLDPGIAADSGTTFVWTGEPPAMQQMPYRLLLADGRRWITPVLWLAMFSAQVTVYGLTLWLPTLLSSAHMAGGTVALAVVLFAASSGLGAVAIARFVDRHGAIALAALPLSGVPAVLAIASVGADSRLLMPLVAISGLSVGGALQGLLAIAGQFYPTPIRANAVGAAVFVSRFGSVLGPYLLGLLLAQGVGLRGVFYACAAPLLITGASTVALGLLQRARAGAAPPAAAV